MTRSLAPATLRRVKSRYQLKIYSKMSSNSFFHRTLTTPSISFSILCRSTADRLSDNPAIRSFFVFSSICFLRSSIASPTNTTCLESSLKEGNLPLERTSKISFLCLSDSPSKRRIAFPRDPKARLAITCDRASET